MKLLVTGGSGFLGRRVVAHFQALGWDVVAPGHKLLDITDFSSLKSWFQENRPEAVIHTAAVSDTKICQREPEYSETVNVTGTVNLAKMCREFGAKFAICSSDQVYFGSTVTEPHREDEALSPANVYGGQKLRAEKTCLEIFPETVCLRLSWMYARERFPEERENFLSKVKAAVVNEAVQLSWPVYDRRGITDVDYVVKNLPKALELPGGIWNFGSENDAGTYDTVKEILEQLKMDSVLRRLKPNTEAFAENPRNLTMDLAKLKQAGITFPTSKEGLFRALKKSREDGNE